MRCLNCWESGDSQASREYGSPAADKCSAFAALEYCASTAGEFGAPFACEYGACAACEIVVLQVQVTFFLKQLANLFSETATLTAAEFISPLLVNEVLRLLGMWFSSFL